MNAGFSHPSFPCSYLHLHLPLPFFLPLPHTSFPSMAPPPIRTTPIESLSPSSPSFPPEPLTPASRAFCTPSLNLNILVILGCQSPVLIHHLKDGIRRTLLTHKRFSSILQKGDNDDIFWVPTNVNLDDHVRVVAPEDADTGSFVEEYVCEIMKTPLDMSKPLFEVHVVKAKLGDAMENIVLKIHHSMGDGTSLMSLLLACTRRVDEPDSMPTLPGYAKKIQRRKDLLSYVWTFILILWLTLLDMFLFLSTCFWLKDSKTSIKGSSGTEKLSRRLVHASVSLDDVRIVKHFLRGTVNDVMYGMLAAGVARYLREQNDGSMFPSKVNRLNMRSHHKKNSPNLRIRTCALVNTRPSPGLHDIQNMISGGSQARWGNEIGYVILPVPLVEDPLQCLFSVKKMLDQKKLSFAALLSYRSVSLLVKLTGLEMPTKLTYRCLENTTLTFSNVVGPLEAIHFFGHQITHILPTVYGQPQALCIHFQSYMDRISIVISAAKDVVPDPEELCKCIIDALREMKDRVVALS